jgi:hypothetical protein
MANEYEAFGGMRLGKGNQSTPRKPASVLFHPSQILHDLMWNTTLDAAMESQHLSLSFLYNYC